MAFTFSELRTCIPAAGQAPAWDVFLEAFPPLQLAREIPQSPRYHGEGDVWTHTKMVVCALVDHPEYAEFAPGCAGNGVPGRPPPRRRQAPAQR